MQFKIKVAEKTIDIHCLYDRVWYKCQKYITCNEISDFCVCVTADDLERERAYAHNNNVENDLQKPSIMNLEETAVYRKICERMLDYSTILLHGAVVSDGHEAYMFMAKSGVGKTTRASLWLNEFPGSFIVNGDKPLIRVTESNLIAYGTPWCGKEGWNENTAIPLKAIFIVERAEKGIVEKIGFDDAFRYLFEQTYFQESSNAMTKTIMLLYKFNGNVDFFKFKGPPTNIAIRMAHEALRAD